MAKNWKCMILKELYLAADVVFTKLKKNQNIPTCMRELKGTRLNNKPCQHSPSGQFPYIM